jgi:polysaccharide biosynthesis protein PelG
MAGIGFQLRRLADKQTISSIVAAAGHAAVIAAGPWLFTIFALGLITLITEQVAGLSVLADFRAIVIYAFAVSLVFAAPVTIVATRLVGDALWLKQPERIPGLLMAGCATSTVPVGFAALLLISFIRPPLPVAVALFAGCLLVGMIWIALAFSGAVRDYRGVTLSFIVGLVAALVLTVTAAMLGFGRVEMAWGFIAGLAVTFFGLVSRILVTFPHPVQAPQRDLAAIGRGMVVYTPLVLGALIGTAGVWIDKVVFWLSPLGERVGSGLLHAPIYDSTMFIASLVIIPSLGSFVMKLETGFFDRYQQYYATIASHGTLDQIEAARQRLARYTLENLSLITVGQVGLTAIILLTAPVIVDALGLQYRQIAILRYGALGAVFQFVFIAATSMLLFFDRRRPYLLLQVLFFVLNAGLTYITIQIGENAYGIGYFLACFISAAAAYIVMDRTFQGLNFLTFIGNNPSITPASEYRGRRALARS